MNTSGPRPPAARVTRPEQDFFTGTRLHFNLLVTRSVRDRRIGCGRCLQDQGDALKTLEEGALPRLNFKGKVFVENHHLAVPFHELLPVREKGLSDRASLHDNLLVHGDNLAALKSLLPTCHGKVKCI